MTKRLAGKRALITGAAQGIGAAIAAAFVREGAQVVFSDINDELGRETAARHGGEYVHLDVREETNWQAIARSWPQMDIVVNNAGITGFEDGNFTHDPEHADLQAWRAVHATNLDGTFLGCRYAIAAMREKGKGAIINISSRSGMVGIPLASAYASSKAAVRNHTKSVALYCAQQGLNIRCNSIHPAAILTPMWEPMLGDGPEREERMQALVAETPMQRFGMPEEVAALAILLASDEAPYVTGTEITIDGGILAGSAVIPGKS